MKPAEAYILKQDEPFKSILLDVKAIIEAVVKDVDVQYKWKLPFFYFEERPLCYLNQSKDYVDVCFWHSAIMEKHTELFVREKRKSVVSLRYKSVEDVDAEVLVYVLEVLMEYKLNPFKRG
jgi:hypothetical protein